MSEVVNEKTEDNSQQNNNQIKNSKEKISDVLIWGATIFGVIAIAAAVYMPFFIKDRFLGTANYPTYSDLGPIGDYIGGTTVAILTAASVFLLLATIIMQRREIKISQQGIEELVKQTEASVKQAKEARKEAVVTNETMRRQQFESTFFNMIGVHQNLVDRLKSKEAEGYHVIEESLKALHDYYFIGANEKFKKPYIEDDYVEILDLVTFLQMSRFDSARTIQLRIKTEVLKFYRKLDFRDIIHFESHNRMIKDFWKFAYQNEEEIHIDEAFHDFIINYESVLDSYFNSITTIIKFLSKSEYESKDRENITDINKVYREIFFSQLSPQEMALIYYYSRYYPENEWLAEELKVYNLFYPRLVETVLLFWSRDKKNIQELSTM